MRLSIKTILWLWVCLALTLASLMYAGYSRLQPDTFIALLTEQVQRNYPGSKLEVGKVDYKLSVDLNLNMSEVVLRRSGNVIAKLSEIELKVPWWLLLFNRGNAQINLNGMDIFVDNGNAEALAPESKNENSGIKISLPVYLADAHYTLRAKDVSIKDLKTSRRLLGISRLLVREFQYGKNSAFEMNLPVHVQHKGIEYNSELWIFGDVTPDSSDWALNYRGEFRTTDIADKVQFEDLIIEGKSRFRPEQMDMSSHLTFSIDKEQIGTGVMLANDEELFANLNFTKLPVSMFAIFQSELHNPYFSKLEGEAEGTIKASKKHRSKALTLSSRFNFPGKFLLPDNNGFEGKWRFSLEDSRLESSFISPKGEASFFRRSIIDFKKGEVAQYVEEIGFSGVELGSAIQSVLPLEKLLSSEQRYYSTSVSFKECLMDEKPYNGMFKYGIAPDSRFYHAEIGGQKKTFKLDYQHLGNQKSLDLVASSFPWQERFTFLSPFFSAKNAEINGKVEGRWQDRWDEGKWLSKIAFSGLTSEEGFATDLVKSIFSTFKIDIEKTTNQHWNGSVNKQLMKIDSLVLDGPDPINVSGQMDTTLKIKSFLQLKYPKNKKWKPVTKEVTEFFWKRGEV